MSEYKVKGRQVVVVQRRHEQWLDAVARMARRPLGRRARQFWAYVEELKARHRFVPGPVGMLIDDRESIAGVTLISLVPSTAPLCDSLPAGSVFESSLMPDANGVYVPLGKGGRSTTPLPINYPYALCPGSKR